MLPLVFADSLWLETAPIEESGSIRVAGLVRFYASWKSIEKTTLNYTIAQLLLIGLDLSKENATQYS